MEKMAFTQCTRVYFHTVGAFAFVLLAAFAVQAQIKYSEKPIWYYPNTAKSVESGSFEELKNSQKVYVTVMGGYEFLKIMKNSAIQQLRDYDGFEIVDSPELADMAVYINVSPSFPMKKRSGNELFDPVQKVDIKFFVTTRGKQMGGDFYTPRVIVKNTFTDTEGSLTIPSLQIGSFIKRIQELKGK